tara:strand:+ start:3192 stop:3446 length:255 start_codon:yes stop_codon:yes gene_type:complete
MRYLEKADVDLNTGLFNVYLKKCPDINKDVYYCTTNNPKKWIKDWNSQRDKEDELPIDDFLIQPINQINYKVACNKWNYHEEEK